MQNIDFVTESENESWQAILPQVFPIVNLECVSDTNEMDMDDYSTESENETSLLLTPSVNQKSLLVEDSGIHKSSELSVNDDGMDGSWRLAVTESETESWRLAVTESENEGWWLASLTDERHLKCTTGNDGTRVSTRVIVFDSVTESENETSLLVRPAKDENRQHANRITKLKIDDCALHSEADIYDILMGTLHMSHMI